MKINTKKPLNENIKIFKSKPEVSPKDGEGYWLFISSDSKEGPEFESETSRMSVSLNLTKDTQSGFGQKFPGVGRPLYYKDRETGQFGWGFFITKTLQKYPEKIEQRFNWLKELVRSYNIEMKLKEDVETGALTLKNVGQLQNLESAMKKAIEMNPETKAKLEQYLDELANSIEQDEVFDFLAKKYEEASKLVKGESDGTVGHKYKITNSMIILAVDPDAIIAGQKEFWEGRGYQIKPGKESGISIWKPGEKTTAQTSRGMLSKPGSLEKYQKERGIAPDTSYDDMMKSNPKLHKVDTAHTAIVDKAVRTTFRKNEMNFGRVYTNTMVEPAPGAETTPMEELIGKVDADIFHIPQKELDSDSHREMMNTLFNALGELSDESHINTSGVNFMNKDINEFNKLLNIVAFDVASKKLPSSMGVKGKEIDSPEVQEMIQGYSEAISSLVKKNFGLPSESSVFNAARHGVDKEEIGKVYSQIIRIADEIIKALNSKVRSKKPEQLAEVRKLVRNVLRGK